MEIVNALGRRKTAVARIYLSDGDGKILINKRDYKEFFPTATLHYVVEQPLQLTDSMGKYDIKVNLSGGGTTGQGMPAAVPVGLPAFQATTGRGGTVLSEQAAGQSVSGSDSRT